MRAVIALGFTIVVLAALLLYREHIHAQERSELLNRIQAPEVVINREIVADAPEPELVPVDMGPWTLPPPDEDDE